MRVDAFAADVCAVEGPDVLNEVTAPDLTNFACLRDTVTSSKKMSFFGDLPTVTVSALSKNLDPASGPRTTNSSAEPTGSDSMAAMSSSLNNSSRRASGISPVLLDPIPVLDESNAGILPTPVSSSEDSDGTLPRNSDSDKAFSAPNHSR